MHFRLIDVYEATTAEIACGRVAGGKRLSVQNQFTLRVEWRHVEGARYVAGWYELDTGY